MPKAPPLILRTELEPDPTEAVHQEKVMQLAALHACQFPELGLLHHIPNGGHRAKATALALKRGGVKPGVPDLCLPVGRGGYLGAYFEMKRFRGSYPTEEQKQWIADLAAQGYYVVVCKGWRIAWEQIHWYLSQPPTVVQRSQ